MTKYSSILILIVSCLLLNLSACQQEKYAGNSDQYLLQLHGYEGSRPSIVYLPELLDEISGFIYYPKDSSIIAIVDNVGILYKLPLYERPDLQKWPFSNGEDFEEIILHDSTFYAVQSNGNITTLKATREGFLKSLFQANNTIKLREFEAAVYDTASQCLLLICKDCEDDSTNVTSVWAYDTGKDSMLLQPAFTIDQTMIEQIMGKVLEKFKPSGAAVHPITGDYYLISAINDLLVVIDRKGQVKEATALNKYLFKQPEGLSFKPNGDLLISNESADIGKATILLYEYKPRSNIE